MRQSGLWSQGAMSLGEELFRYSCAKHFEMGFRMVVAAVQAQ